MTVSLILASASPRRLALLSQIGVDCTVVPADVDETPQPHETATELVQRLAVSKAKTVAARHPDTLVLAADTVVHLSGPSGLIFGKPKDRDEALSMLQQLSGNRHCVSTGMALVNGTQLQQTVVTTEVDFGPINEAEQQAYWDTGEPVGKAGAYAIQGRGAKFVTGLQGSYSNVVGLPLYEASAWLTQAGLVH